MQYEGGGGFPYSFDCRREGMPDGGPRFHWPASVTVGKRREFTHFKEWRPGHWPIPRGPRTAVRRTVLPPPACGPADLCPDLCVLDFADSGERKRDHGGRGEVETEDDEHTLRAWRMDATKSNEKSIKLACRSPCGPPAALVVIRFLSGDLVTGDCT